MREWGKRHGKNKSGNAVLSWETGGNGNGTDFMGMGGNGNGKTHSAHLGVDAA